MCSGRSQDRRTFRDLPDNRGRKSFLLNVFHRLLRVSWRDRGKEAAGGLAAVFYLLFYIVILRAPMTRGLFNNRELVVLLTIAIGAGSA